MEDEEPDYMSDTFLTNSVQEDIRPGLIHSRAKKREHETQRHQTEVAKQQKLLNKKVFQRKTMEEGLSKPIDSSNKGFALLQKMGYKPGTGIGKDESGRTEPIGITLKNDRKGLGRESVMKEIKALKASINAKKQRIEPISVDSYRARLSAQASERLASIELGRSQIVCHDLDAEEIIEEPLESWFWPPKKKPLTDEDSDESDKEEPEDSNLEEVKEYTVFEKLTLLTSYLRAAHFYCLWCGVKYDDAEDMSKSCPGSTRDEH